MAPKLKLPPKGKRTKANAKSLDSPDDFQAGILATIISEEEHVSNPSIAAAELEENAGGKWRAGDKAKSARAFMRAIEMYDRGLARHPQNFDLAYNKARLVFEVAEQPAIVAESSLSRQQLLELALTSHKYALRLNEENTDILFNTAQILITLAEHTMEEVPSRKLNPSVPTSWLRESLELLDSCFSRQEMLFAEQMQAWSEAQAENVTIAGPSIDSDTEPQQSVSQASSLSGGGEEATMESSVQASDLLDTARASLEAITLLVEFESATGIQTLRGMAEAVLTQKIPRYQALLESAGERLTAERETRLQDMTLRAALASSACSNGNTTAEAYIAAVLEPGSNIAADEMEQGPGLLCTYADTMVECIATLLPASRNKTAVCVKQLQGLTEQALSLYERALAIITAQQAQPSPPPTDPLTLSLSAPSALDHSTQRRLAAVHERRGDTFLLLRRVALLEASGELHGEGDLMAGATTATTATTAAAAAAAAAAQREYGVAQGCYRGAADGGASGEEQAAFKARVRAAVAAVLAGWDERRGVRCRQLGITGGAGRDGSALDLVGRELDVGRLGAWAEDVLLLMDDEELIGL